MATVVDVLLSRMAIFKAFGDDRSVKGFERLQEIVSEAPDLITLAQTTATDAQTKVNGLKSSVQFLTLNTTGLLSAERALVGTAGQISLTDGGAGGNATLALVDTAVTAGSYGDATHVGAFTVDAKGRLTSASSVPISFPASGATAFTGLSDVPASYSGQSLKAVRVNAGETALEFYTPSGGGGGDLLSTNNLSDLTSAGTALTNLGLSANGKSLVTAANYAAMRTALGLVIGTDVQAYNANLTTYAGIAPSANVQTLLGAANYAAFRSSLSIGAVGLLSTVTEADQTLADNTTNNATTGRHGYLKKLSNAATEYMDGTGNWSTPAGAGSAHAYELFGVVPTAASFTSVSSANLTLTDGTLSMLVEWSASGLNQVQLYRQAAPSTPYDVYMRMNTTMSGTNVQFGVVARASATGRFVLFAFNITANVLTVQEWTNPTTFSSTLITSTFGKGPVANVPVWLRIKNDGTTLTFYYSRDGSLWVSLGTRTLATFLGTCDQIGFGGVPSSVGNAWIGSFGTSAPA